MDSTSYEYKHPTSERSAYVTHDKYSDGDEEFLAHIPGQRATKHSSFEKAQKRVQMHGYGGHEEPETELGDVPVGKSYRSVMESFDSCDIETIKQNELDESAAPGMEDWILSNKKHFIDQYGEKKGLQILYATAWKLHDKKQKHLDEAISINAGYPEVDHISGRRINIADINKPAKYTIATNAINGNKEHRVQLDASSKNHALNLAGEYFRNEKNLQSRVHFDGLRVINESVDQIVEMVMDAIKHPTLGKVEWHSTGNKHTITYTNPDVKKSGEVNVDTMGPHREITSDSSKDAHKNIAAKWKLIKSKLLKEDAEWIEESGMNQLVEAFLNESIWKEGHYVNLRHTPQKASGVITNISKENIASVKDESGNVHTAHVTDLWPHKDYHWPDIVTKEQQKIKE